MKMTCPECKTPFSQDEAIDKSWVFPEKHFGCPHCKTYFANNPFRKAWGTTASLLLFVFGMQAIIQDIGGNLPEDIAGGIVMVLVALILGVYSRRQFAIGVQQLRKIDAERRS